MAFHATTFISEQTHRLDASVYQSRSGGINISLHESSLQVKEKILSIIRLINESRVSYDSTLSETLNDRNAHVEKSQSVVYAIYLRYLELSRSMASQEQLMRINGTINSPSGLVGAINRNSLISGPPLIQLVILPEHFSRRDFQQKISSCRKCSTSSPQTNVIHAQRNRDHSCGCQLNQGGQKKNFTMSTSLWDGSQYKLTLVISLRAKVLLKVIFAAFVHNMSVAKFCRRAVALCCQKKLRRLMKRCFQSIQFEGLSTRYITICSDRSADSLICKKYMKPALDRLRFNIVTSILCFARLDAATRHRKKVQMRSGFEALFLNKSGRRSLCKKKRWASLYSMNKIVSRAFMAWCATSALKDHDEEKVFTSEFSEKMLDKSSPAVDVSFDGDSLSSSDSPFSINRLKDCRSDRTEKLLDSNNDNKEPCAVWNVEVQDPVFTEPEAPFLHSVATPKVLDNSQNDDRILQCIDGQSSSSRLVTISLVYPRNRKEGNTESSQTPQVDVDAVWNTGVTVRQLEIPSHCSGKLPYDSFNASADISPHSSKAAISSPDALVYSENEEGHEVEEGEGEERDAVDNDRQHDQQDDTQEDEDADEGTGRASSMSSSSSTGSQPRSKQYQSGNVTGWRSNAISSLSKRPKSGRLEASKGTSDSASRGCTVGNPFMRHCVIKELSYLNSSESGADTADDDVVELIPESLLAHNDLVIRVSPTHTGKISPSCSISEGVGVEFEGTDFCHTKRTAKLSRSIGAHRQQALVYSESEVDDGEGEEEEAVDKDMQHDQQHEMQEDEDANEGAARASSVSSSSAGSESDWSQAFTEEARNKNDLNVNKSKRILLSSVPCDSICSQSLPPPASTWDSTLQKYSSVTKKVTHDQIQTHLQMQNRMDEENRVSIQQLINQQSKKQLKLPQSQPPVCGTDINSSLQDDRSSLKREHIRKQKNKRNESSFSPSATALATTAVTATAATTTAATATAATATAATATAATTIAASTTAATTTAATTTSATTTAASAGAVTPQADWGYLPISSVGKSLLDDSDLESLASLKGSSMTYVPPVLTVFSSSDESNVYLQGTTSKNDTMQVFGEYVHKDVLGVRTPGSLTQSSCDGSVCTPDSFIGYTAATLQGAITPTPAEPGTGTGTGPGTQTERGRTRLGTGRGTGTQTGTECVLQRGRALDIPVSTPLKVSRMLPVQSLRCVLLLSKGVSLQDIEALEHLEAKNPGKECSPSSVMTSPEVSKEVLEAIILIRRCRRYFQKLRSTVRISRAYRTVRRMHR
jgi:hypothetical protein